MVHITILARLHYQLLFEEMSPHRLTWALSCQEGTWPDPREWQKFRLHICQLSRIINGIPWYNLYELPNLSLYRRKQIYKLKYVFLHLFLTSNLEIIWDI